MTPFFKVFLTVLAVMAALAILMGAGQAVLGLVVGLLQYVVIGGIFLWVINTMKGG